MDLSNFTAKRGDRFLFVKDVAGTPIFTRLTLGDGSLLTETGRLDAPDQTRKVPTSFGSRGAKTPHEVALEQLKKEITNLLSRHYEVREGDLAQDIPSNHYARSVAYEDKAAVRRVGGPFARLYAGKLVEVTVSPDGKITTYDEDGEVELPNRVRSGIHKSHEANGYTLLGVLTWLSPSGVDHSTKKQADYHGGSKPNLVIYDLRMGGGESFDERRVHLENLCETNKWLRTKHITSVYAAELYGKYPEHPDVARSWTGVISLGDAKWTAVKLNESEYFVVVGGTEDYGRVALIKYSDAGPVPYGTAKVSRALRQAVSDVTVYDSVYADGQNYTRRKSSDFGLAANEVQWMHPKDFYVVSVNRGVLDRLEPSKDVQGVEVKG